MAKDVECVAARQEGKRRSMDIVKEDMQRIYLTEEDGKDRVRW